MNGFTPEDMSRGGDAAAAVAAVVAAAAAAASAGNGAGAGAGAEVPGAGGVSAAGPPGAAGPGPGQLCCLREDGERCGRAAGNASFSKRIQKSISQKKVKIELDKSARHLYICDYHKNLIQSVRNRRKRKGSDDDGGDSPVQDIDTPEVDLYQLQVNTLRRYKRHFKLPTRPGLNKAQLVEKFYLLESKYAYQRPSLVYYTSIGSCRAQNEKSRKQVNILQWTSLFPFSFSINNFYSE
nr:histone deacetylase complex subunit SAP30 isoform X1 [Kogia breviceps]